MKRPAFLKKYLPLTYSVFMNKHREKYGAGYAMDGFLFMNLKNDSINIPPAIKQIDRDKGYKRAQFPFIVGEGDKKYLYSQRANRQGR